MSSSERGWVRQVEWELERERNRERVGVSERERLCAAPHLFQFPWRCTFGKCGFPAEKKQQKNKNKEKPEELKTSRASKNWEQTSVNEGVGRVGGEKRRGNWGTGTLVTHINKGPPRRRSEETHGGGGGADGKKVRWGTVTAPDRQNKAEWLLCFVLSVLAALSPYPFPDPVPSSSSSSSFALSRTCYRSLSLPTVRPGRAQRLGRISISLVSLSLLCHPAAPSPPPLIVILQLKAC